MHKDDPRQAKTLDEACANDDGTYNGIKLLSWLSEVFNPTKGFSEQEVRDIANEVIKDKNHDHSNIRPIQYTVSKC